MEELIVNHIGGDTILHLKGKEVQVRDTFTNQSGVATFKDSADAMRFVSEYISNLDGPTEEFSRLYPQLC